MSAMIREQLLERLDALDESRLIVTPLLDRGKQVGAGSIDLRLGTEFLEVQRNNQRVIDPFVQSSPERSFNVPLGGDLVLHPGQLILGATLEFLVMPADLTGQVLSRSSWGRVGLLVATAVAVQPGFRGVLTLELVNAGDVPIVLRPGLRVAQLQVWQSTTPTNFPYSSEGKYDAPLGPQSHRLIAEKSEQRALTRIGRDLRPGWLATDETSDATPRDDGTLAAAEDT
jgi:dCTP deaminase